MDEDERKLLQTLTNTSWNENELAAKIGADDRETLDVGQTIMQHFYPFFTLTM